MPGVGGQPPLSPDHYWDTHSYSSSHSLDRAAMMSYHRPSVQSNGYSPDGPDGGVGEEAPHIR